MGRWKYRGGAGSDDMDDMDDTAKVEKIRRRKGSQKKSIDRKASFALAKKKWVLEKQRFVARVVEVHKRYVFISPIGEDGALKTRDVWLATVARRYWAAKREERNLLAVGDDVLCEPTKSSETGIASELPTAMILHRDERRHKLARRDPMNEKLEHVIASNVDQINIVASFLKPQVKWGLIDRYLTLVEEQRLCALIILNKKDLLEEEGSPEFKEQCESMIAVYKKLGYEVITLSAERVKEGEPAHKQLGAALSGKTSLFVGHSGVGKSSLVNLFEPEITQEVEDNPDIFYKGRHTTTYSSLIKLKGIDGYIVDTPGVRSLLVGERSSIELTYAFKDMRPYLNKCAYRECRHLDEEGCAILQAVDSGLIHSMRYRSYKNLLLGGHLREGRSGLLEGKKGVELEEDFIDWQGDEEDGL